LEAGEKGIVEVGLNRVADNVLALNIRVVLAVE
jgi:hypothetical protein